MRKLSTLLLSFTAPFFFAQQAGDVVSFEQKLDLTPARCYPFHSRQSWGTGCTGFCQLSQWVQCWT